MPQRCKAHKRDGTQCGNMARVKVVRTQLDVCRQHGGNAAIRAGNGLDGGGDGRPPIHNLYSRTLQNDPEMLESYEYFKSNPEICGSREDIAIVQAHIAKWISGRGTGAVGADYADVLVGLYERLSRIKEREHKRVNGERVTITTDEAQAQIKTALAMISEEAQTHFGTHPKYTEFTKSVASRLGQLGG